LKCPKTKIQKKDKTDKNHSNHKIKKIIVQTISKNKQAKKPKTTKIFLPDNQYNNTFFEKNLKITATKQPIFFSIEVERSLCLILNLKKMNKKKEVKRVIKLKKCLLW